MNHYHQKVNNCAAIEEAGLCIFHGNKLSGEACPCACGGEACVDEELSALVNALREKVPAAAAPADDKALRATFENAEHVAEIVVRMIGSKIPKFKDSNFMVVNAMWGLVTRLAESPAGVAKHTAAMVAPAMVEKISDRKIKASARACLSALTEVFFADAAVTSVLPFMLANWGQFGRVWPWTRWPVNATAPAERYAEWVSLKAIFCM